MNRQLLVAAALGTGVLWAAALAFVFLAYCVLSYLSEDEGEEGLSEEELQELL